MEFAVRPLGGAGTLTLTVPAGAPLSVLLSEVAQAMAVPLWGLALAVDGGGTSAPPLEEPFARLSELFPGARGPIGLVARFDETRPRPAVSSTSPARERAPPPQPLVPPLPREPVVLERLPLVELARLPAPPSAPGDMPASDLLRAVTAACRDWEPLLLRVLAQAEAAPADRGPSLASLPPLKATILARQGFDGGDAEFAAGLAACCAAARALTDREAPSSAERARANGGKDALPAATGVPAETRQLNADAILQTSGLGLAAVWANRVARAEERWAAALAAGEGEGGSAAAPAAPSPAPAVPVAASPVAASPVAAPSVPAPTAPTPTAPTPPSAPSAAPPAPAAASPPAADARKPDAAAPLTREELAALLKLGGTVLAISAGMLALGVTGLVLAIMHRRKGG